MVRLYIVGVSKPLAPRRPYLLRMMPQKSGVIVKSR